MIKGSKIVNDENDFQNEIEVYNKYNLSDNIEGETKIENQNKTNYNKEFRLREKEYKAIILQLEGELNNEINQSTESQKSSQEDTLLLYQQESESKDKEIKKLLLVNTKQRQELVKLSRNIDDRISQLNSKKFPINKKNKKNKDYLNDLKIKEEQLKNALSLIEILKKDNEHLKEKYKSTMDLKEKDILIDKSKESDNQIIELNTTIKKMKKDLIEHSKCQKIKEGYNSKINLVKGDLNQLKIKNIEMRNKIQHLENQISKLIAYKNNDIKEHNELIKLPNLNHQRKLSVPIVEKNRINTCGIFTEKESKFIKEAFLLKDKTGNNYNNFIKKIETIETYKHSIETSHKVEMKSFITKNNDLDRQIEFHKAKNKEIENQTNILNLQLIDYKTAQKTYKKKIFEFQANIENLNQSLKDKEQEIKNLCEQLSGLRKIIKNSNNEDGDKGIINKNTNESFIEKNKD